MAWAAPGDLDGTFGKNGKRVTDVREGADQGLDQAIADDGRIVVVGGSQKPGNLNGDFVVARYTKDGRLDRRFSRDGLKTIDFHNGHDVAWTVAIQRNGMIVVAGSAESGAATDAYTFALARLTARGRLDKDFSGDGRVSGGSAATRNAIFDIALAARGKIVAAGTAGLPSLGVLARYRRNGTLDPTFGDSNNGVEVVADGGSDYAELDAVALDGSSIWAAGTSDQGTTDYDVFATHFDKNGDPIDTFGGDGIVITDFGNGNAYEGAYGLAIDSQGRPVVAGEAFDNSTFDEAFLFARYQTDGDLDPTFNPGGPLPGTELESFRNDTGAEWADDMILVNGKVVAAGIGSFGPGFQQVDFAVLRLNRNGGLDTNFSPSGQDGITYTDFKGLGDKAWGIGVQPSGRIVVSGRTNTGLTGDDTDIALARYKP